MGCQGNQAPRWIARKRLTYCRSVPQAAVAFPGISEHIIPLDIRQLRLIAAFRLTPAEARTLLALYDGGAEGVSLKWLIDSIPRGDDALNRKNIIAVNVSPLRKKLGGPGAIQNIWGPAYFLSKDTFIAVDTIVNKRVNAA